MEEITLLFVSIFGAISTFFVSQKFDISSVFTSAFLSFLVAIACHFLSGTLSESLEKNIPIVFIGASFVGMTSPKIISQMRWIALAGLFFGFIYMNASHYFSSHGGGLGTTAALSVIVSLGLIDMFHALHKIKNKTS